MKNDIISIRLAEVIKESGLSHAQVEEKTGISKSAIQRYAAGDTNKIPVDRLQKIVEACNSSILYVLGIDKNSPVEGINYINKLIFLFNDAAILDQISILELKKSLANAIDFYSDLSVKLSVVLENNPSLLVVLNNDLERVKKDIETTNTKEELNKLKRTKKSIESTINRLIAIKSDNLMNIEDNIMKNVNDFKNTFTLFYDVLSNVEKASPRTKKIKFLKNKGIERFGNKELKQLSDQEIDDLFNFYAKISNDILDDVTGE